MYQIIFCYLSDLRSEIFCGMVRFILNLLIVFCCNQLGHGFQFPKKVFHLRLVLSILDLCGCMQSLSHFLPLLATPIIESSGTHHRVSFQVSFALLS